MKVLINYNKDSTRVAITQDRILENFFMEKSAKKSIAGNIYKAKVERVIPALNASFLNFGEERQGFLPIEDFSEELTYQGDLVGEEITPLRSLEKVKKGDEILVQVIKDSIGTKGPKLT
ncbi:MAG: Rne/Rng family ribonuclease, partial [Candidatus Omnitrophica bacterium]|nr:Rne/Rng family ribonuclease [Candidatus Omnitrophota bacterium]